jgi:hypothetical protein
MTSIRILHCVFLWFVMVIAVVRAADPAPAVRPLPRAHAHNDYAHPRPLLDALEQGFCNVEADVFLIDGRLLVGHSLVELRPDRTLVRLYLQPLRERVQANGGRVYPNGPEFTLMIDFKSAAEPTYQALLRELDEFREILTSVQDGKVERRAVSIVLSGNRPIELVKRETSRWVGIDGRPGDLESDVPAHFMPWISDSWSKHFRWNGRGEMPVDERTKLQQLVERTHRGGRRLRFWAAPDRPEAWSVLAAAGVDLINTDDLAGLARFLRTLPD